MAILSRKTSKVYGVIVSLVSLFTYLIWCLNHRARVVDGNLRYGDLSFLKLIALAEFVFAAGLLAQSSLAQLLFLLASGLWGLYLILWALIHVPWPWSAIYFILGGVLLIPVTQGTSVRLLRRVRSV